MSTATIIIVLFLCISILMLGSGGAYLLTKEGENTLPEGVPTPVNTNPTLAQEYPVIQDPVVANRDCSVQEAVYTDVTGTCQDSSGNILDGTPGRCGTGTGRQRLDLGLSQGFVPASGTGTCDILEKVGECEVPCPSNCEGGRWIEGQACVRMNADGSKTALYDGGSAAVGTCGSGQQTMTRDVSETDPDSPFFFKPSQGSGTCAFTKTSACERECSDGVMIGRCGYSGIKVKDRDIGSQVLGHEGCVKKDPNGTNTGAKDETGRYIPVEAGEDGFERWYEAAYYGDTSKCNDLVEWRSCKGPPVPQDCVGDWIKQPDTESEWSACKLPEGQVCGATFREKKYHISTPKGTRQVGGVTIDNGKDCRALVTVDGQDEERVMEDGGQLTFTEWCGETQRIKCCEKTEWVEDEARGCALDEGGENPTKRYTREVSGACGPNDAPYDGDPDGNATEKFEGCCYTSPWENGLVDAVTGKVKQTRTVKNCGTQMQTEQEVAACYIAPTWENAGECGANGQQKQTRVVHNERLCDPSLDTSSTRYVDCCYSPATWTTSRTCQTNGKLLETRTVRDGLNNNAGLCSPEQAKNTRDGAACCYIDYTSADKSGSCQAGTQRLKYAKYAGNCTSAQLNAGSEVCCDTSEWQNIGTCDNSRQKKKLKFGPGCTSSDKTRIKNANSGSVIVDDWLHKTFSCSGLACLTGWVDTGETWHGGWTSCHSDRKRKYGYKKQRFQVTRNRTGNGTVCQWPVANGTTKNVNTGQVDSQRCNSGAAAGGK